MRIGYWVNSFPPYSETFFKSKIDGLTKKGHQVYLFLGQGKAQAAFYAGAKVVESWPVRRNPLMRSLLTVWVLVKTIFLHPQRSFTFIRAELSSGRKATAVIKNYFLCAPAFYYTLDWLHFGFATLAIGRENIGVTLNAKVSTSIRGIDIAVYPLKHKACYRILWKRLSKLHTLSTDLLQVAYQQGLPDSISVQKITPAIDVNRFESKVTDRFNTNELKIVTSARLHWKKGLSYTLDALHILRYSLGVNFTYYIIGDGEEYERLRYSVFQLQLEDCVQFLGVVPHEQVPAVLDSCTIYLQYSIQEGFCNSVLEAQAMGLLTIVSDAEGLPENVIDGETGWVVKSRAPEELAHKIKDVWQMENAMKQAIATRAVTRVRNEFTLEKQQQEFQEFFQ